jgi:hypothetical protein
MADQTAMNVNGGASVRVHSPLVEGVLGNLADFGSDVATLAELQAKLAVLDLKESAGKAMVPVSLVATAGALALGSLPVGLLGVAELLVTYAALGRGWAYLITSVTVTIVAGILAAVGVPRLQASFASFRRSREELTRNVAWIKTVLAQSGRYTPGKGGG